MNKTIQKYHIKAKKNLGQNFLVDETLLDLVISQVTIQGKNIIEVGPGYGALTEKILNNNPDSVTLVELDTDMIDIIKSRIDDGEIDVSKTNFTVLHQDVLKFHPQFNKYDVLANIPYYITSPILRHFLYNVEVLPDSMLILMQKDVADKILSGQNFEIINGEKQYKKQKKLKTSVLSLFIQKKAIVKELSFVPREAFSPSPKVDSSFLLFEIHDNYSHIDDELFMGFIKGVFAEQRKKLIKSLVKLNYEKQFVESVFKKLDLDENIRPEKLDIESICELIEALNSVQGTLLEK